MKNQIKTLLLLTLLTTLIACQSITRSDSEITHSTQAANTTNSSVSEQQAKNPAIETSLQENNNFQIKPKSYSDLWERIRDGFQLNEHYSHKEVEKKIGVYGKQHYFDLMTERASPFLYWIVEEIDRRNLPQEFVLLPMVESTYNPNAYSREHAVGLWQFLSKTGKSFGLQQDWWFDGRRDPYASTVAALDYLQELHQQFNEDWLLAIAAYNTGNGNLRKAIRRSNKSKEEVEFWELALPSETKAHIPKLLALAAIISNNEKWDIELEPVPNNAVLKNVSVGSQIDLSQAASLAEIDYELLRTLNSGYLQWATHPDHPQDILLPFENAQRLEKALLNLDHNALLTWDRYEIKPGDTLGGIARKLNTRVDILQRLNSLPGSLIVAGKSLLIPRSNDAALLAAAPEMKQNRARQLTKVPAQYKVRNGDNLWKIARRFNLKSKEIATWNQIELEKILRPGQILDLQYSQQNKSIKQEPQLDKSSAFYVVQNGDTINKIARHFGIGPKDLLLWNNLHISELIFPGQTLQVRAQRNEF